MLIKTQDSKGTELIAIANHLIRDMEDVGSFRDCLMKTLELVVSNPETKDSANPYHLYILSSFIQEVTNDLDNYKEKKGGEV